MTGIEIASVAGTAVIAAAFVFTWWKSRRAGGGNVGEPRRESPLDEESLEHLRVNAKALVWGGFMNREEIVRALPDIAVAEASEADIAPLVDAEFTLKRASEKTWPEKTDCDRLDEAFDALNARGIFAQQYLGYTQSDALGDLAEALSQDDDPERYSGYCFYTAQDVEHIVIEGSRSIYLGFGTQSDDTSQAVQAGKTIREVMTEHGFETDWDGSPSTRIEIRGIDWKRRGQIYLGQI